MTPRKITWFGAMALLTLLAAATAPAFPMQNSGTAEGTQEAEIPEPTLEQRQTVEAILREHEEARDGPRFSYDPEDRRDPFRSLFDLVREGEGPRPPGVDGMAVDEIDLTGIVVDPDGGDVAYFTGSDNKGYFLRVGRRFLYAARVVGRSFLVPLSVTAPHTTPSRSGTNCVMGFPSSTAAIAADTRSAAVTSAASRWT